MLGDAQRLLTTTEIADFLARHPLIALQVAETKAAVAALGFDQIYSPPSWYEIDVRIPGLILPNGICVVDSAYGNVVIAPNATGTLYYNAFVDAGHCAAAQQDWTGYQSTPGGFDWNNFFSGAGSAVNILAVIAVVLVASTVYKNVKA
jgi:hypothetical protein